MVTHRTNNENWSNKGPYEVIGEGNPAAILEKIGKHILLFKPVEFNSNK